ncbi:MAG: RNA polymerase sigma factor [Actinomycetota bacterium]
MVPPFQAFLDAHKRAVYRYLAANLPRPEVEDCFQETFLAALRAYPNLRSDSNLRAWVLRIAERKVLDAHRARQRLPVPQAVTPDRATTDGHTDYQPEVWEAVRGLPAKQRAAVVYRYVTSLRYAEIGPLIGSSEEAARQNVRAGLQKLREVLK